MSREEFDLKYLNKAVHCNTEAEAKEFLKLADNVGYSWSTGDSLNEHTFWEDEKLLMCYCATNEGVYWDYKKDFIMQNVEVVEFEGEVENNEKIY